MELWRYIRTLRRRIWLVIFVWVLCMVGVYFLAKQQAKGFTATATVKEQIRDYDVNVTTPRVQIEPLESRMFNIMSYITSDTVVARSLEDIGLLTPTMGADDREKLIEMWASSKHLTAAPLQARAALVQITVRTDEEKSEEGRQAKAFADAVLRNFQQFYKSLNTDAPRAAVTTLTEQKAALERAIQDNLRDIERFTKANQMTTADSQVESTRMLDALIRAQANYEESRMHSREYAASADALERKLDELLVERTSQSSTIPNPIYQDLMRKINDAETDLSGLVANRTEKHPDVITAREKLAELQSKLAQTPERIPSVQVSSPNPVHDEILNQYNRAVAQRDGARAAEKKMGEFYRELQARAAKMPAISTEMANLKRQNGVVSREYRSVTERLSEAEMKLNDARTRSAIAVIDPVKVTEKRSNMFLYVVLAVVLGFVLACGVAFTAAYMDNTVRTQEQAESLLQLPMYATLPRVRSPRLEIADPASATVAAFEMLSTNLWLSDPEIERPTFLVASALPDAGRSTVAANLAITLARDGARVILVDSDFRDPQQHIAFGVSNDSGLSNVLAGDHRIEDVLVKTNQENLLLIPSGPQPQNPVRLLRGKAIDDFVQRVTGFADFVIFDSPAGVTFADASLLAAAVRNVIVVHQAGRVPRGAEDEFRRRLERVDANLVGAVLNRVRREDSHGYYHFHRAYKGLMAPGKYGDVRALPRSGPEES
jgi:succinoglycan biosynthesis transport protein ExoP